MSLVDRFPHTSRLTLPPDAEDTGATCPPALQPYLDWQLAMLDPASSDILVQSPDERELVILSGTAANLWLHFHAAQAQQRAADAARGPAQAGC